MSYGTKACHCFLSWQLTGPSRSWIGGEHQVSDFWCWLGNEADAWLTQGLFAHLNKSRLAFVHLDTATRPAKPAREEWHVYPPMIATDLALRIWPDEMARLSSTWICLQCACPSEKSAIICQANVILEGLKLQDLKDFSCELPSSFQ